MRIPLLPNWVMTGNNPAFYDSESLTAIQQTARLYGAVRQLQEDYNTFAAELETNINNFESATTEEINTFKAGVSADLAEFREEINNIHATVVATATEYMREAIYSGELAVSLEVDYNIENEELTIELLRGGPANA